MRRHHRGESILRDLDDVSVEEHQDAHLPTSQSPPNSSSPDRSPRRSQRNRPTTAAAAAAEQQAGTRPPLSPERLNLAQQQQYRAHEQQQQQRTMRRAGQHHGGNTISPNRRGADHAATDRKTLFRRRPRQSVDQLMESLDNPTEEEDQQPEHEQKHGVPEFMEYLETSTTTTNLRSSLVGLENEDDGGGAAESSHGKVDSLLSELDRHDSFREDEPEGAQQQHEQYRPHSNLLDQDPSFSTRAHERSLHSHYSTGGLQNQSTSLTMDQPQPLPFLLQQQQQSQMAPLPAVTTTPPPKLRNTETLDLIDTQPHYTMGPLSPFSPLLHRKKRPRPVDAETTTAPVTVAWKDELPPDLSLSICRKVSVVVTVHPTPPSTSIHSQQQQQPCIFPMKNSSRDLIVVNPNAMGGGNSNSIPLTMETARRLAETTAGHCNTTDWARTYKFHQVIFSDNDNNSDNESPLSNIAKAVVNDLSAPGSIAHRILVGLGASGCGDVHHHSTKQQQHSPMQLQLFGNVGNQSVARVFSAPQSKFTATEILQLYGLVGLIANGILQQLSPQHACTLSVLEIHEEENLYDLLSNKPYARHRDPVTIRYGAGGAAVTGLSETPLDSLKQVGHLLRRAFTAATHPSRRTSRGHIVVTVARFDQRDPHKRTSCLLVDLASADEKEGRSHAQDPTHNRHNAAIRQSISTLGLTLHAALLNEAGNDTPISYRETLLTKVLQKAMIQTDSRVIVLATVSPAVSQYEESLSTLRYANRLLYQSGQPLQSPFKSASKDNKFHDDRSATITTVSTEHISLDQFEGQQHTVLLRELISDPRQRLARVLKPSISASAEVNDAGLEPDGYRPTEYASPADHDANDYLNPLQEESDFGDEYYYDDNNPHHSYDQPLKDDPPEQDPTPLARNGLRRSQLDSAESNNFLFVDLNHDEAVEEELIASPFHHIDEGHSSVSKYSFDEKDLAAVGVADFLVNQSHTLDDMASQVAHNMQHPKVRDNAIASRGKNVSEHVRRDDEAEEEHSTSAISFMNQLPNQAQSDNRSHPGEGDCQETAGINEEHRPPTMIRNAEKNTERMYDKKFLDDNQSHSQDEYDLQQEFVLGASKRHATDAHDLTEEVSLLSSHIDGSFDAFYPPVGEKQQSVVGSELEDILREPDPESFDHYESRAEQQSTDKTLEKLLRNSENPKYCGIDDTKHCNLLKEQSEVQTTRGLTKRLNVDDADHLTSNGASERSEISTLGAGDLDASEFSCRSSDPSARRSTGYGRESKIPKLLTRRRNDQRIDNGKASSMEDEASPTDFDNGIDDEAGIAYDIPPESPMERSAHFRTFVGSTGRPSSQSAFSPVVGSPTSATRRLGETDARGSNAFSALPESRAILSSLPASHVVEKQLNLFVSEEKKADIFSRTAYNTGGNQSDSEVLQQTDTAASVSTVTQSLKPVESFDCQPDGPVDSRHGAEKDAFQDIEQLHAAIVNQTNINVWQSSLLSIENLRSHQMEQQKTLKRLLFERDKAHRAKQELEETLELLSEEHRHEMASRREEVENAYQSIEKIRQERAEVVKICEEAIGTQAELEERVTELEQDLVEREDYYDIADMLARLEEQLKGTQKELVQCKKTVEDRDVQLAELKITVGSFEAERNQLVDERVRAQREIESLKWSLEQAQEFESEAAASRAEVSRMRNQMQSLERDSKSRESKLLDKYTLMEGLHAKSITEAESARVELSKIQEVSQREALAKRRDNDHLQNEIAELHEALAAASATAQDSQRQRIALADANDELSKELFLTRDELNRRISDVQVLSRHLKELLSEKERDQKQIKEMKHSLTTIQDETRVRVDSLVRSRTEAASILEKSVRENEALVQTNKKLQSAVSELQQGRVEAEAQGRQLSETILRLDTTVEEKNALEEDNARLRQEVDAILRDHMAASTEHSKMVEKWERDRAKSADRERELARTVGNMDTTLQNFRPLQEENERLARELDALRRSERSTAETNSRSIAKLRQERVEAEARERELVAALSQMETMTREKLKLENDNENLRRELDAVGRDKISSEAKYSRAIDELRKRVLIQAEEREKKLSDTDRRLKASVQEKIALEEVNDHLSRELQQHRDRKTVEIESLRSIDGFKKHRGGNGGQDEKLAETKIQREQALNHHLAGEEPKLRLSVARDEFRVGDIAEFFDYQKSQFDRRRDNVNEKRFSRRENEKATKSPLRTSASQTDLRHSEILPAKLGSEEMASRISRRRIYPSDESRNMGTRKGSPLERSDLNRAEEVAAYLALSAKSRLMDSGANSKHLQQAIYDLEDAKDHEINALKTRIKALERRITSGG